MGGEIPDLIEQSSKDAMLTALNLNFYFLIYLDIFSTDFNANKFGLAGVFAVAFFTKTTDDDLTLIGKGLM